MKRLQQTLGAVLARDPDIAAFGSIIGAGGAQTTNTGRFFIALKPRDERTVDRLAGDRPAAAAAREDGGRRAVPAAGAGHHRRRPHLARPVPIHAAGRELDELTPGRPRVLEKLKTLPQLADVSSDQQANAPQLSIRSTATRRRASASSRK